MTSHANKLIAQKCLGNCDKTKKNWKGKYTKYIVVYNGVNTDKRANETVDNL